MTWRSRWRPAGAVSQAARRRRRLQEDAIVALRAGRSPWLAHQRSVRHEVAFLFPGRCPAPGMAFEVRSEPAFRAYVDGCLEILRTDEGIDLRSVMFPPSGGEADAAEQLLRPSLALPALLTIELALAHLLQSWGIAPSAMVGHGIGEYAAAHLAGVFSLHDALGVVTCRGRLFETLPNGGLLSVGLTEGEVLPELPSGLSVVAVDDPGLYLVSGEVAAIVDLESRLSARGIDARRLAVAVAPDAQALDPILGEFEAYLRRLTLSEPMLPFVSSVTGTWIRADDARDPGYWVGHLRQPMRFADGLSTLTVEAYAPRGRTRPHADICCTGPSDAPKIDSWFRLCDIRRIR